MVNYYLLMTKPGIVIGNLITVAAGFLLASKGDLNTLLFVATMLGLALIMASGCVFNNYIDRFIDQKMDRTKNRVLAQGIISGLNAMAFGAVLLILGNYVLVKYTTVVALLVADFGFFVYVLCYSILKSKTVYGTAIGSVAGAVPPVVGYCAVSNQIDSGAFILFVIMVLWQMPHFFSIAIYRLQDYAQAAIPVLPLEKGITRTKIHMLLYIQAFIMAALALTFMGYTGYIYFGAVLILGLLWLGLCLTGFNHTNDTMWGCQMFRLSLLVITMISIILPFDLVP